MPLQVHDLSANWFQAFDCRTNSLIDKMSEIEFIVTKLDSGQCIKELCVQSLDRNDHIIYIGVSNAGVFPERLRMAMPFLHPKAVCKVRDVLPIFEHWVNRIEGKVLYSAPEITFESIFDANSCVMTNRSPDQILHDTQQYDRLLLWLSAHGYGSYRRFGEICKSLFPDQPDLKPSVVRKQLRLLGHIAESPDGMRWRVLSPLLVPVRVEGRSVTYTLVGARDSKLKARLTEAFQNMGGSFIEETQLQGDGPSTWSIVSKNKTVAKQIAKSLKIELCNNYEDCIELLPDINGYRTSLAKATVADSYYYDFRLFDGQTFQSTDFIRAAGMYEIWTTPEQRETVKRDRTLFFDQKDNCWRSGDWYGLRYLHHKARKTATGLRYETTTNKLLCPEAYRLPEPYEQALIIASGKLPELQETRGNRKRVFQGVSQQIAKIIAKKVGARLTVE
jgi:hypothetical protein